MNIKRLMAAIGVILILLGSVTLIYRSVTYKSEENVIKLGQLKVTAEENKNIYFDPMVSGLVIVAGAVLLIAARK